MAVQGEGKIGMANESESLVEVALGMAWETRLLPKCLSEPFVHLDKAEAMNDSAWL
jgi:hypothetical protein